MDDVDRLLPVEVAKGLLGLGRTRFYEILNAGEIRAVRLGRRTLIPASEIRRYQLSLPPARFGQRSDTFE
jgi:excisionase family DNA binding protein